MNQSLRYSDQEFIRPPHGFCPGCGAALALRYFLKAVGDKVILVIPPGCSAPSVSFPRPSLVGDGGLIDVIHCPFGSSAIFAGGIKAALETRGDTKTQVIAWAGDGATFDIGFGALSAAAQRNENIIYVCYDNEAYMNTGNQKSGSTPGGSSTTTTVAPKDIGDGEKDLLWIMMGHDIPYAATATIAYPDDLMAKARKAAGMKGFRLFHILTPCVPGWKYPPHLTVKLSKLAVQTGLFPLAEYEKDRGLTLRKKDRGKPLEEYTGLQGRFKGMDSEEMEIWTAAVERRWNRLSRISGEANDS
ncbi:MAG: pyruvate synthase subunit beta [Deltaproteobacteria bacterium]|nr:pyruvate synthase subunit beta [Deltaproteobacteria bacterium]